MSWSESDSTPAHWIFASARLVGGGGCGGGGWTCFCGGEGRGPNSIDARVREVASELLLPGWRAMVEIP